MPFKYVHNDYNGVIKSFISEIMFNYDYTLQVDSSWSNRLDSVVVRFSLPVRKVKGSFPERGRVIPKT